MREEKKMGRKGNSSRPEKQGFTRRNILKGASISMGVATVGAFMPSVAKAAATEHSAGGDPVTEELPGDVVVAPTVTQYETDILVIGSGYAGISAAVTAKDAGKRVLLVDKGHPAYSGCSPFAQCYMFFDKKYGDNAEAQIELTMKDGEYIANLDWYKVFLDESRSCFDQLVEWGIYAPIPKASQDKKNYYASKQEWEYHQEYATFDRRFRWNELLEKKKVDYVDHTMIMDVIEQNGRIAGAIGFHVPSGAIVTFKAKAVIMCMGCGSYKNSGFPTSGNAFAHEWIAYRHGIPVTGKEWDFLGPTNSVTPSSSWRLLNWGYLENLHLTAVKSIQPKDTGVWGTIPFVIKAAHEGIAECKLGDTVHVYPGNSNSSDPTDPRRTGNDVDDLPRRDVFGCSVGMGNFKCNGIFCGVDDLVGYTGLPGLYVAGDALASMMYGATYSPGQGGSTVISQLQGRRSAKAASAYVEKVRLEAIDPVKIESLSAEILSPLKRKKGIDPRWAVDVLHSVMAPWWVSIDKNEEALKSALVQVGYLRDKVLPVLVARNPHDLRLCHEVAHKVLDAEMKLRASLERKESRGGAYRSDYPYRDDRNFLCYITLTKGKDGSMVASKVPVKDSWKGDMNMAYEKRYPVRLPGEAKAMGLKSEGKV